MKTIVFFCAAITAFAQVNVNGNRVFLGSVDLKDATWTIPYRILASNPSGSCAPENQIAMNTVTKERFICASLVWVSLPGGGGGGGGVSSVFGRTGFVVAMPGDYTAAQVTNAVSTASTYSDPAWITSLAWSKLTGIPSTFAPTAHTHASTDITDWTAAARAVFSGTSPISYNSSTGAFSCPTCVTTAGSYTDPAWVTSLAWGKLTGVPSSFAPSTHTHAAEDIVSGAFADARIAASSVTQHQASLSLAAGQITTGTFANARISEGSVTQHQGSLALTASQIISGVFSPDRIPGLDAAKTISGVFNPERLGTGTRNGARFLRDDGVWSETPGAVASVFGRTGVITAQAGDYTAAQITNAVSTLGSYADPAWITSLAYSKLTGAPTLRYQTLRANGGPNATQRGRVNFIAGANVTITAGDSPGDDETTITIAATGGGGGGFDVATQSEAEDGVDNVKGMTPLRTKQAIDYQLPMGIAYAGMVYGVDSAGNRTTRPGLGIRVNSGAVLTPFRTNVNLIAGTNVTITSADNGALDATNITIAAAGGGSGPQVVRYAGINSGTVPAWGVSIPLTGGPELLAVEDGVILSSVLRFTANDQYVQAGFALPATFSSVTVRLQARTSSTSGNMAFAFRTACVGSGETLASASWNTAQTITMAASATASGLVQSSPLTATVTGCSANEMFFWRLTRTSDTTTANPPDLVSIAMEVQ